MNEEQLRKAALPWIDSSMHFADGKFNFVLWAEGLGLVDKYNITTCTPDCPATEGEFVCYSPMSGLTFLVSRVP